MECPRCQNLLEPKEYENISVVSCPVCYGIWLSSAQLSQIITLREEDFSEAEITETLKSAHAGLDAMQGKILHCPLCNAIMEECNYDYNSGVLVNVCPLGDGLWFDKDELTKVQIFEEHWEDEARIHEKELREKLNQIREEESAKDKQEEISETANITKLSQASIFDRVFQLFHLLKVKK